MGTRVILHFLLTKQLQTIMINTGLSGETGANPVRARRRKTQESVLTLPKATFGKTPLEVFLRRPDSAGAKPEDPDRPAPLIQAASAGRLIPHDFCHAV